VVDVFGEVQSLTRLVSMTAELLAAEVGVLIAIEEDAEAAAAALLANATAAAGNASGNATAPSPAPPPLVVNLTATTAAGAFRYSGENAALLVHGAGINASRWGD
jgi:hypothetical protein